MVIFVNFVGLIRRRMESYVFKNKFFLNLKFGYLKCNLYLKVFNFLKCIYMIIYL